MYIYHIGTISVDDQEVNVLGHDRVISKGEIHLMVESHIPEAIRLKTKDLRALDPSKSLHSFMFSMSTIMDYIINLLVEKEGFWKLPMTEVLFDALARAGSRGDDECRLSSLIKKAIIAQQLVVED